MANRLALGLDERYPGTFCKVSTGAILWANGEDDPKWWNGDTADAFDAGVRQPATSCVTVTAEGSGSLYGDYTIYYRYIDDYGNPGCFSTSTTIAITSGAACANLKYVVPADANQTDASRHQNYEIWRNTDGQTVTFYKDGTGTVDTTTVTTTSARTDGALILQDSLRYLTADGYPNANRFEQPPSHMSVVVSHLDRSWWAVPNADYSGDDEEYNTIYFSEATEPESVPSSSNTIVMQEDGDVITGLMPYAGGLYIFKRRHVYLLSTAGDPRRDGRVGLVAERGCVNQRCWARVEGLAFAMDKGGIYAFDGNSTKSLSGPVQDYFRGKITWHQAKWFHACHDPASEVVRFFVCMEGNTYPRHALCYYYRADAWSVEEYATSMGCSGLTPVAGEYRPYCFCGTRPILLDEGALDGPAQGLTQRATTNADWDDGTLEGTITAATMLSVTDSSASMSYTGYFSDPGIAGSTITVFDSDGTWQTRKITKLDSSNSRFEIDRPWSTLPASGDRYVIGGIEWKVRLGSFTLLDTERDNPRTIKIRYKPVTRTAYANLRVYYDQNTTPETYPITFDTQDGLTVEKDSTEALVDLTHATGCVELSLAGRMHEPGPAHRSMDVELRGVAGREKIEIYEVEISGVS